jgi:lipoyl-dependent peroxiredoxin
MATTRTANTHWEGYLLEGKGTVSLSSSNIGTYDVSSSGCPRYGQDGTRRW